MRYTYRCDPCDLEFDKELTLKQVLNHARPPKFPCPACKGKTRKIITKASIQFKGAGFYSTDNKK